MPYDLVIKNGLVINSDSECYADVAIDGAVIRAIGQGLRGKEEVDAQGCYVIPGGIDPHVHLQLPLGDQISADSFADGTIAAACGGTTTVIDFATPQPEESMVAALAARRAEADGRVAIDYGLHMTIPTWHGADRARLTEIPAVLAAGCATFKLYQAYAGYMLDDEALFRALQAVGAAGGRAVLHSETGPLLEMLRTAALAQGCTSAVWHERTRPTALEASAIQRATVLAHLARCPLFVFHIGCADGVAALTAARQRGLDVLGESCPHYLFFTDEEHLDSPAGHLYICAPPLRSAADQAAIWQALANDQLQVVSTDHCPWTPAQKTQPDFTRVPGGIPGIEARLALIHHGGVVQGRLSRQRWVQLCATNAARWMGLANKGVLAPGYQADVVIFDPQQEHVVSLSSLHEKSGWSPYAGMAMQGWPRTIFLGGKAIVVDGAYVGSPGDGRFVARHV
ncbi:MAG: dihydropyrimidinase [Caldilineaceae bacterium]